MLLLRVACKLLPFHFLGDDCKEVLSCTFAAGLGRVWQIRGHCELTCTTTCTQCARQDPGYGHKQEEASAAPNTCHVLLVCASNCGMILLSAHCVISALQRGLIGQVVSHAHHACITVRAWHVVLYLHYRQTRQTDRQTDKDAQTQGHTDEWHWVAVWMCGHAGSQSGFQGGSLRR